LKGFQDVLGKEVDAFYQHNFSWIVKEIGRVLTTVLVGMHHSVCLLTTWLIQRYEVAQGHATYEIILSKYKFENTTHIVLIAPQTFSNSYLVFSISYFQIGSFQVISLHIKWDETNVLTGLY
jgi:hypothetical protein